MASAELSRRGQAARYRRGDRGEPTAADDLLDLERPEGDVGETAQQFVESCRQELNEKLVPALEDLKSALQEKHAEAVQDAAARLEELARRWLAS